MIKETDLEGIWIHECHEVLTEFPERGTFSTCYGCDELYPDNGLVPFVEWIKAGKPSGGYDWQSMCEDLIERKVITRKFYDPCRIEREQKKERIKKLEKKIKTLPSRVKSLQAELVDEKRELKELK
jgi:hypothetical protein